jgi:hypothetical protein
MARVVLPVHRARLMVDLPDVLADCARTSAPTPDQATALAEALTLLAQEDASQDNVVTVPVTAECHLQVYGSSWGACAAIAHVVGVVEATARDLWVLDSACEEALQAEAAGGSVNVGACGIPVVDPACPKYTPLAGLSAAIQDRLHAQAARHCKGGSVPQYFVHAGLLCANLDLERHGLCGEYIPRPFARDVDVEPTLLFAVRRGAVDAPAAPAGAHQQ